MVFITEELVRKRAEHNECEIHSLEELSLHQLDIERIEFLDKWCKDLKILYLQSNLIPKIENLGRLKKLEYLNLTLNNIEFIENLEGCEFLNKLDLTLNFIGDLTSVENLVDNYRLKELYLTGNPCTEYEHYKDFVIATLPQLKSLDGIAITKSDRIKALQNFKAATKRILKCQDDYYAKRTQQKAEYEKRKQERLDKNPEEFWNQTTEYTPESRLETHKYNEEMKKKDEEQKKKNAKDEFSINEKKPRRYMNEDGQPFNCNEPKVDFEFNDTDDSIVLNVAIFKHMDTSLVDVDVQPNYVRVKLRDKVLQLVLSEEVKCDVSTAKRSQVTGHLLITMPKVNPIIRSASKVKEEVPKVNIVEKKKNEVLEVGDGIKKVDYKNIVNNNNNSKKSFTTSVKKNQNVERENSQDFVDDPDVPSLI